MYEFHKDRKWYFEMQTLNAEKSVLPFIEEVMPIVSGMKVLEVGCAEGGVLKAFSKTDCVGVGVELDEARLQIAIDFNQEDVHSGAMTLVAKNVYDLEFQNQYNEYFDLIVLKDVIEHIHDQEKVMMVLKNFLKPDGYIFFGFPPFNMPFGGHQQVAQSKLFAKTPYTHLLPMPLYKVLMRLLGEHPDGYVEVKETGISINRFEHIVADTGLSIANERHFIINPIYEFKFGWKPRVQYPWIKAIPHLRDFLTTCVFYLVKK